MHCRIVGDAQPRHKFRDRHRALHAAPGAAPIGARRLCMRPRCARPQASLGRRCLLLLWLATHCVRTSLFRPCQPASPGAMARFLMGARNQLLLQHHSQKQAVAFLRFATSRVSQRSFAILATRGLSRWLTDFVDDAMFFSSTPGSAAGGAADRQLRPIVTPRVFNIAVSVKAHFFSLNTLVCFNPPLLS